VHRDSGRRRTAGLRVDELLDERRGAGKTLGAPLQRVRNVSGLTILGNGEICALLNPADLLRTAHKLAAAPAMSKLEHAEPSVTSSILLWKIRCWCASWKNASSKMPVTRWSPRLTVWMPSMYWVAALCGSGIGHHDAQHGRPHPHRPHPPEPRYRDLPVILVTSLASDEDKRRGLEVGANAYIPKPTFDQRVLLETLQRLIVP